ncbi:MAG: GNAT family N-acetyltransferase [Candidatus Bathyarchaeota archaeon]|nr:GNAT family N-acetyltransferase [Candidatus Bathyarchaeota archaeon]
MALIRIRIDVDYPYPSRMRSFICTAFSIKMGGDYLKNAKIIAKMINEAQREVKAYWFFTFRTLPDNEMLELLVRDKHEVALHIVNDPYAELELLEKATKQRIKYYTVHGTARLLARLMWGRRIVEDRTVIQSAFPLKSFHEFPTFPLDYACAVNSAAKVARMVDKSITQGDVLEIHPEWLFNRGTINRRGPFYGVLKNILHTDSDLETLAVRKKGFIKISSDTGEYMRDIVPSDRFIEKLGDRGIDIFTFIERKWCNTISNSPQSWLKAEDNIALLKVVTYDEWQKNIGKKTRNMIRKAEKSGVKTEVAAPTEKLAEGIWKIYNESPIRQERAFPHYGVSLQSVTRSVLTAQNCTFVGAFLQDELVGFIQLVYGDKIAVISQILARQQHADKAVNNALVAKAVEVCAAKQVGWVMYGRMGNHPSLDRFKESNGFVKFPLTRYYVPITKKGRFAAKLGLHRELKDVLPQPMKQRLFPLYNWASRAKMRMKLRFGR